MSVATTRPLGERSRAIGSLERDGLGSIAHWRALTTRFPFGRKECRWTPLSATIVPSSAIDGEKYGARGRPLCVTATFREPSGLLIQTSPRLM